MKPIISVEGLGKKYVIRHEGQTHYKSLREEIFQLPKKLFRRQKNKEEFWALKDVSFDIMPGDRVGIIGRNGAGKSTLLKLLSRITEPSAGRITMRGRVASLLEVGTGFHPELTGRENIYLNGAILGMSRAEVRRKFDEIVEFSGVEKFLDTPVKRYSSGMYVRLAFAVAAHLEPEILIVDEVLAVGDAEFQKKCLGKMKAVGKEGRTVLFVSHNMNAIELLCSKAILLDQGQIKLMGDDVLQAIATYVNPTTSTQLEYISDVDTFQNDWFSLRRMALVSRQRLPLVNPVRNDVPIRVLIEGVCHAWHSGLQVGIAVYNDKQQLLFWTFSTDTKESEWPVVSVGENSFYVDIPSHLFNVGRYTVQFLSAIFMQSFLHAPESSDLVISFDIEGGLSESPYWQIKRAGILAPIFPWKVE